MPEPEVRAEAIQWLGFALGDLAGARAVLEGDDLPARLAAFQAQQAAEKAIKALLILTGQDFERTHDLEALVLRLPTDAAVRGLDVNLEQLSNFAVGLRYPDALTDVGRPEAEAAVQEAESIVQSVIGKFERNAQIGQNEITAR